MTLAFPLGFLFGFIGSMPVAGPIALLVIAYGMGSRFKSGLYLAAGGAVAESIYAFVAFWGFASLLERYRFVIPVSRGIGAVLLISTGLYLILRKAKKAERRQEERREGRRGGPFVLGFLITAVNPTLLVTWTAAATALSSVEHGLLRASQALPFAGGAFAGIVAWFALLLTILRRYKERFKPDTLAKVIRGAGFFIIAIGVYFAYKLVAYLVTGKA